MLDTCRRMSSIEVVRLVSRGLERPRTSHLIFGFRVARARFFLVLSARHPEDSFIRAPCLERGISNVGKHSMEMRGVGQKCQNLPIHLPARCPSAEKDGTHE